MVERWFKVPLDYAQPRGESIRIFARSALPNKSHDNGDAGAQLPICLSSPPPAATGPAD